LDELRIGLGCMRLAPENAAETIAAAQGAGITLFDTARAYGENEAVVAAALRGTDARIVTKGGMARPDGAWVPDGRAKTIRADCEASLAALDGHPIDLYLLHAPDPRTPWRTSLRALAKLAHERLVRRVGVCNVNLVQLDEALDIAPISAVQIALSVLDDHALRGGIVERCERAGITLLAHSPLGGPKRAARLARRDALVEIARAHDATPHEIALAWLLHLSPVIVPIPGATRPETARSAARAAMIALDEDERAQIGGIRPARSVVRDAGEVVVIMGIPGAGKSRLAERFDGYTRLNRDDRGGSLRELARALDEALASSNDPVVLDNTYLTRAARSHVLDAAHEHGRAARCVWLDTPLAQAQINVALRVLDGAANLISPTSQMRTVRELEPPADDEGWDAIERVPFVREPGGQHVGVFVAAAAAEGMTSSPHPDAPHLVFDWNPEGSDEALTAARDHVASLAGDVDGALCPHPGGPPACWCRPPLPLLPLAFARTHHLDLRRCVVVGCRPAHRALADALGSAYLDA
jgi:aryl-alcohol dehydrogenase-like predicted oxidoreductase/predicted kinase